MPRIETTAEQTADALRAKREQIASAVSTDLRSTLLAVEREAVKRLSGSNGDAPGAYPVPVRTGELRRDRTVQQPSPGVGLIFFNAAYANAIETGENVTQWAGRGKTRRVSREPRPFAQDAIDAVVPSTNALQQVFG